MAVPGRSDHYSAGGGEPVTGNPYYHLLELMHGGKGLLLALATLDSYEEECFTVEGKRAPIAGRAAGLSIDWSDEGCQFLCVGSSGGWFVLCRLEER